MVSPKYFSIGLRLGICESKEVQAWVNEEIEKAENPPEQLIELAYIKESDVYGLYSALDNMPDTSETYDVVRKLLGNIKPEKLNSIEFCRRLAECLYSLWVENDYTSPEDLNAIGFFDDEYALAAQGTYGTLEEWHNDLKSFVSSFVKNC